MNNTFSLNGTILGRLHEKQDILGSSRISGINFSLEILIDYTEFKITFHPVNCIITSCLSVVHLM